MYFLIIYSLIAGHIDRVPAWSQPFTLAACTHYANALNMADGEHNIYTCERVTQ